MRLRPFGSLTVLIGLFLLGSASTRAQVTFTIHGNAATNGSQTFFGYSSGQAVTFAFTLAPNFSNNFSSNFIGGAPGSNSWSETTNPTDGIIWASINGTGLTGTYNPSLPTGNIQVSPATNPLQLNAQNNNFNLNIGVTANGVSLSDFITDTFSSSSFPTFATSGSYVNPATYFSVYAGTYALNTGILKMYDVGAGHNTTFTATSLTIGAVPEPSTYAALIGLAALGYAAYCRWRRQVGWVGPSRCAAQECGSEAASGHGEEDG